VERSVADHAECILADWKGETGSRAAGRSRLSVPLSARAVRRARICRSATASPSRASIALRRGGGHGEHDCGRM